MSIRFLGVNLLLSSIAENLVLIDIRFCYQLGIFKLYARLLDDLPPLPGTFTPGTTHLLESDNIERVGLFVRADVIEQSPRRWCELSVLLPKDLGVMIADVEQQYPLVDVDLASLLSGAYILHRE